MLKKAKNVLLLVLTLMLVFCNVGGAMAEKAPEDMVWTDWGMSYDLLSMLNGYNVIAFGDADMTIHCVGALLIEGDLKIPSFADGVTEMDEAVSGKIPPSYIKGYCNGVFNGRNDTKATALYVGPINKVVSWESNGNQQYSVNGIPAGMLGQGSTPPIYVSDDYFNFELAKKILEANQQSMVANAGSNVVKPDRNGTITVNVGDNVIIESLAGVNRINIIGDHSADVNTTISILDEGSILMPTEILHNGNQPEVKEWYTDGSSIVWNYPNADEIIIPSISWVGHVIAPNAHVNQLGGNYNGTIICNSLESEAEGHIYRYGASTTAADEVFVVTKVWNDGDNAAGKRPPNVKVELRRTGTYQTWVMLDHAPWGEWQDRTFDEKYDEVELSARNDWSNVWEDLPATKEVVRIKPAWNPYIGWTTEEERINAKATYYLKEVALKGPGTENYTTEYDPETGVITNSMEVETITISGKKTWNDELQDHERGKGIVIRLLADNEVIAKKTFESWVSSSDMKWEFTDLPKYKNGKEIKYTIEEEMVDGYLPEYSGYDVINNVTDEAFIKITGKKIWNDNNNQDGVRPASITIELLQDGKPMKPAKKAVVSEKTNWEWSFEYLPKSYTQLADDGYNQVTIDHVYSIHEVKVPEYETQIQQNGNDYTVTNTHEVKTVNLSGTKTWVDNNNAHGLRPQSITIWLTANGIEVENSRKTITPTTVGEEQVWSWTYENLPKYKNGREIKYAIREMPVLGYTTSYSEDKLSITNTEQLTSISGTKSWMGDSYYDWVNPARPQSITVKLKAVINWQTVDVGEATASAANNWTYSFDDLPVYGSNGEKIQYTVEEVVPEGYSPIYEGYDITNRYGEYIDIYGQKQWNEVPQGYELPETITLQLSPPIWQRGEMRTLTTTSAEEGWNYRFTDLPKKDYQGNEITYTVTEVTEVDGFISSGAGTAQNNYTIVNTYNRINIPVEKIWSPASSALESATVKLLANGEETGDTLVLSAENQWKGTFENLDKKDENGNEIQYSVTEDILHCDINVTGDKQNGFKITNTLLGRIILYKQDENGKGLNGAEFKLFLDEACTQPYSDEKAVSQTIGREDGKVQFDNIPVGTYYIKEVKAPDNYTLNETVFKAEVHYKGADNKSPTQAVDKDGNNFLKNKKEEEKASISVTKVWNDSANNGALRPEKIQVQLYNTNNTEGTLDDTPVGGIVELPATDGNWSYTWTGLDKYVAGTDTEIVYRVDEVEVPDGYFKTIQATNDGFTITNALAEVDYGIEVDKTLRHAAELTEAKTFYFDLFKYKVTSTEGQTITGETVGEAIATQSVVLDAETVEATTELRFPLEYGENWFLLKERADASDTSITYADNEYIINIWAAVDMNGNLGTNDPPRVYDKDGKQIADEESFCDFTFENTYNATRDISVTKVWANAEANAVLPSIQVQLYKDGVEEGSVTLSAEKGWNYTWEDLPKYGSNGQEITYTVVEVTTDEMGEALPWTTEYVPGTATGSMDDGFTITNTKIADGQTHFEVTKAFNGTLTAGQFSFALLDENGVAVKDAQNNDIVVTNKADGKVEFPVLTFDTAGTYKYQIKEIAGNDSNIIYDGKTVNVEVTVAPQDGQLVAAVKYDGQDTATFTNTLVGETTVVLEAKKTLNGADYTGAEFAFELKDSNGTKETVRTVDGGKVVFAPITYKLADLKDAQGNVVSPKTFTYTISEVQGSTAGVTYSTDVYTAKVTVTCDASTGTLRSEVDYEKNGTPITGDVPEFANATETVSVSVTKVWNDNNNEAGKRPANIQVQLRRGDDHVNTVELPHQGNWSYTWNDLPKYDINGQECVYRVVEITMDDNYLTLPWVEDYVPGEPVATDKGFTITNTLIQGATENIGFTKVVKAYGAPELNDTFTIKVVPVDDAPALADDEVEINLIRTDKSSSYWDEYLTSDEYCFQFAFDKAGTYVYKLYEAVESPLAGATYDETVHRITFTVSPSATEVGKLECSYVIEKLEDGKSIGTVDEIELLNEYVWRSISVKKNWDDEDNKYKARPESIQVQLKADGANQGDPVTLNAANSWSYTWNNLLWYSGDTEINYTVEEITKAGENDLPWVEDYVPGEPTGNEDKGFTITNTYVAGETDFGFMKLLDGEPSKTAFEFNVDFGADEDNEKNLGSTVTNMTEGDAAGYILVGPLTYGKDDLGKTYTYTISEKPTEGYYCDSTVYTVTVKIADELSNGEMQIDLSCKKNGADLGNEEPLFKNASAIIADLPVQKTLITNNVNDVVTSYSFTLTPDGATEPEQTIDVPVTGAASPLTGSNKFELSFAAPGTYTYTVAETVASKLPGYTYDEKVYTVTYEVELKDGKLQRAAGYPQITLNGTAADKLAFTNEYKQEAGSATLHAKKVFTNGDLSATQFTFELLGEDGKAVLDKEGNAITATSNANGVATFPALSYDKEGRYKYVIKEKVPADADKGSILYDTNSVNVTVNVAKEDNQLKAAVEYEDLEAVFTNTQLDATGKVYVKKNFADNKTAAGDYTFTMTPVDNAPELDDNTLTLTFGETTTEASGEFQLPTYTAPGTYQYTVKESITTKDVNIEYDSTDYTVVVTVARDGNKLVATVSSDDVEITEQLPIVFTNKVLTTSLSGTKVWANDEVADRPAKITIRLLADGESTDKYVELAPTETEWSFTDLPVNDENGRPIDYTVAEDAVPGYDTTISGTTITNTKISDGEAVIKAKKTLNNAVPAEGQFTFQLLDTNGDVVVEKTNDASGIVTFDQLIYTEAKDYTYTIVEVMPKGATEANGYTVNGMTYDPTEHTVTVKVEQEGTALVATVTYNGTSTELPVFTNTYEAKEAELTLSLSKTLINGAELPEGRTETFTFVLADEAGAMQDEVELSFTKANGEPQTATFQKLTFDAEGTYKYTISEKASEKEDIISDTTKYVLEVKVDDVDGQLVATQTLTKQTGAENATSAEAIMFTNTYVEEDKFGELTLTATKAMSGREFQTDDSFTFTVAGSEGAPMPANTEVTIEPTSGTTAAVNFGKISFTEADAGKEYTYTIQETEPAEADKLPGVTYDTTEYTVKVKVTEGEDALVVTPTYANGEGVTITNTYANEFIEIAVTKIWVETDPVQQEQRPDSVDVRLYADGEPTDQVLTLRAANLWTAKFTDLQKYVTGTDTPIAYTVKEITEGATWTANYITGEAEGSMANGFTITNTNKHVATTQVDVTKVWVEANDEQQALRPDSVDVQLYADGVAVTGKVLTLTATDGWMGGFANLQKYVTGTATPIVYTVKEVTEGADWLTSYTPGAPAGNMADGYTITNTSKHVATTEVAVTKKWVEANDEQQTLRPDSVDVQLYADGVAVDGKVLTLTATDGWTGKFTDLVKYQSDNVTPIAYTVKEVTEGASWLAYYTPGAPVGDMANGFTITNTNTYDANGKLLLTGTKVVTGDSTVAEHTFTFGVFDASGTEVANGTNDASGNIAFGEIAYTLDQVGTHEYTVKETTTAVAAEVSDKYIVELDETEYTILVSVVNNTATGNLDVTWEIKESEATKLTFTNDFQLRKGNIGVVKVDSKDTTKGLAGAEFTVYTDAACTTTLVLDGEEAIITTGETGAGVLDDLPIGTYWVKETKAPQHYLLDDETVYEVTVMEGDRAMVNEANGAHVTNRKMAKLALEKSDRLNPDKKLPDAEYTLFTEEECENILELPDGTPAIITTGEDGVGELEGVPAGTYWVKETKAPEGYEVDPEPYKVVVPEEDDPQNPVFVQVSDFPLRGALSLSKTVVASSEVTDTFLFDIELTLETGDPIVGSYKATLNGAETDDVTFAATETGAKATVELKDGETLTIIGLRSGVSYTVTEQLSSRYDVTVNGAEATAATGTITDNGHSIVKYQNTLKETGFTVEKVWLGEDAGEIKLTLYANGVAMDPQPEVTRDGNTYSYENLVMKDENGEEIVYTVKETAMAGYTTTYQNAAPNADKTDAAYNGGKIINQAMTTFAVKKEWSGLAQGEKAPAIQLTLYCNGKVYTAATPTPDKDGWYTYADLPAYVDGEVAVYTVKEQPVTGFTTTYINKGENAAVTDCAYNGSTIVNSKIPQTGDNTPLTLWMLTTLLAACGLMGVMATLRKREY